MNTGATVMNTGATVMNTGATVMNTGATAMNTGATAMNTGATVMNTGATAVNTAAVVSVEGDMSHPLTSSLRKNRRASDPEQAHNYTYGIRLKSAFVKLSSTPQSVNM